MDERILLTNTSIPANSIVIADKGFISEELALSLQQQANITLLTPKTQEYVATDFRQIS